MPKKDFKKKKESQHWPSYARGIKREAKKLSNSGANDFAPLIEKASQIEDPYYTAIALAWIGKQMSGTNLDPDSAFLDALTVSRKVREEWRQSEVLTHIASEMSKANAGDLHKLAIEIMSLHDTEIREKTLQIAKRTMSRRGVDFTKNIKKIPLPSQPAPIPKKRSQMVYTPENGKNGKITLGLYNTYAGKTLKEAHIRAISRAGPICFAFGLNLGLFNFPENDLKTVVSIVEKQSQIGDQGRYFRLLYEKNRLFISKSPKSPYLKGLGNLVVTTSHPDPDKETPLEKIPKKERPFIVLVGLGTQGISKHILELSHYHVELTGKGVSLETCTAIGVLAAKLVQFKLITKGR
jgi:hypothetical protein